MSDAGQPVSIGIAPVDQLLAALPIDPELIEQHPEIVPGVAFAGAFIVARILKRLTTE